VSIIKKLIGSLGILFAVGCSNNNNDEQERKDLIKWLNFHITHISQQVEDDIDKEKKGFYQHAGETDYSSKGFIEYTLNDKTDARLQVSENSLLSLNDIKSTEGYQQLLAETKRLGVQITLKEFNVDGDDVESSDELDEYIDDEERYFVIRVFGWDVQD